MSKKTSAGKAGKTKRTNAATMTVNARVAVDHISATTNTLLDVLYAVDGCLKQNPEAFENTVIAVGQTCELIKRSTPLMLAGHMKGIVAFIGQENVQLDPKSPTVHYLKKMVNTCISCLNADMTMTPQQITFLTEALTNLLEKKNAFTHLMTTDSRRSLVSFVSGQLPKAKGKSQKMLRTCLETLANLYTDHPELKTTDNLHKLAHLSLLVTNTKSKKLKTLAKNLRTKVRVIQTKKEALA